MTIRNEPNAPRIRRSPLSATDPDAKRSAQAAGLRYVNDNSPGIVRLQSGDGFCYKNARGHKIRNAATLWRIKSLVIPPAWREVWICPFANGHIQAIGRDAK